MIWRQFEKFHHVWIWILQILFMKQIQWKFFLLTLPGYAESICEREKTWKVVKNEWKWMKTGARRWDFRQKKLKNLESKVFIESENIRQKELRQNFVFKSCLAKGRASLKKMEEVCSKLWQHLTRAQATRASRFEEIIIKTHNKVLPWKKTFAGLREL